jgi:hypothetical protein
VLVPSIAWLAGGVARPTVRVAARAVIATAILVRLVLMAVAVMYVALELALRRLVVRVSLEVVEADGGSFVPRRLRHFGASP